MTPKISIIIPAFNAEKYIRRCLDSILQQQFDDFEVIVVNDGSTDNTLNILKEYEYKDNRIKIINKANNGVSSARNDALNIAKGEWLAFCDADDYYLPSSIGLLYTDSKMSEDVDIVLGNAIIESKKQKTYLKYSWFDKTKLIKGLDYIPRAEIWGYLFKNEIIQKHNIRFDTTIAYAEDKLFLTRYLLWVDSIVEEPTPVYFYAFNGISATNYLKVERKIRDVFYVAQCIKEFAKDIKDSKKMTLLNRQAEGSIFQGMRVYLLNGIKNPFDLYRIYRVYFEDKIVFIRLLAKAYLSKFYKYMRS